MENQLDPMNLIFTFPHAFLDLTVIPGAKFEGHRGPWTGRTNVLTFCLNLYHLVSIHRTLEI